VLFQFRERLILFWLRLARVGYDKNNFPTDRNPGLLRALAGQATQRMKSKSIRQNNFGQNN
jgi:hypothetical protein